MTYSLEFEAQDGCPAEPAFEAEVASRTARVRRAPANPLTMRFEVVLRRGADSSSGIVTMRRPDGATTSRSVQAPSCDEVSAALALVVALTLDPQASVRRSATSPPPVPPPAAMPQRSAGSPAPSVRRGPAVRPGPPPPPSQPEAKKPSDEPTQGEDGDAPAPVLSTKPPVPRVMPNATPNASQAFVTPAPDSGRAVSAWSLSGGAGAAIQLGATPWGMLGGFLELDGRRRGFQAGISVAVFPANVGTTDGTTARFELWTVRMDGCVALADRSAFRVLACGGIEGGRTTARAEPGGPIAVGVDGAAIWFAAITAGRFGIPLGAIALEGQGEVIVPLSRDSYGVMTGTEFSSKFQPPLAAPAGRLWLTYRFLP